MVVLLAGRRRNLQARHGPAFSRAPTFNSTLLPFLPFSPRFRRLPSAVNQFPTRKSTAGNRNRENDEGRKFAGRFWHPLFCFSRPWVLRRHGQQLSQLSGGFFGPRRCCHCEPPHLSRLRRSERPSATISHSPTMDCIPVVCGTQGHSKIQSYGHSCPVCHTNNVSIIRGYQRCCLCFIPLCKVGGESVYGRCNSCGSTLPASAVMDPSFGGGGGELSGRK